MGCGKSTAGKLLAQKLHYDFIDFDSYIELETGKTIPVIFETEGEEKFRTLEHEYLKKILPLDKTVVSLGGGTPCFNNNMDLINKNGTSIYIELDVDSLTARLLRSRNRRPLIRGLDENALKTFIITNLEKRESVYRKAHHTIRTKNLRP